MRSYYPEYLSNGVLLSWKLQEKHQPQRECMREKEGVCWSVKKSFTSDTKFIKRTDILRGKNEGINQEYRECSGSTKEVTEGAYLRVFKIT